MVFQRCFFLDLPPRAAAYAFHPTVYVPSPGSPNPSLTHPPPDPVYLPLDTCSARRGPTWGTDLSSEVGGRVFRNRVSTLRCGIEKHHEIVGCLSLPPTLQIVRRCVLFMCPRFSVQKSTGNNQGHVRALPLPRRHCILFKRVPHRRLMTPARTPTTSAHTSS